MTYLIIVFILQFCIIYIPLLILGKRKKLTDKKITVWSTIMTTIFVEYILDIILSTLLFLIDEYQLQLIDYILLIALVLLCIGDIGCVVFLNKILRNKYLK